MNELRVGIWQIGNIAWLFGLSDRTIAALQDGRFSAPDLILIFTASLIFVGWLFLFPGGRTDG